MNMKNKMTTITAVLLVSLFIIAPAMASPSLPAAFYGTAKINNANVPAGYTITAEINNVQKGTITTTDGKYGGELASEGKLTINDGNNGDIILFYLVAQSTKLKAAQTATWLSGGIDELNLTFTGTLPTTTTPTTTTTGSSGGSSGGGGGGGGSSGGSSSTGTTTVKTNNGTQNVTQTTTQPDSQGVQNTVQSLGDVLVKSGSVQIKLTEGDSATFNYEKLRTILLKSLGVNAALLTIDGSNSVVNTGEIKEFDLNADNKTDIAVKLESISRNAGTFTLTKLAEPKSIATGFAIGNGLDPSTGIIIAVIIIIVIIAAFTIKKFKHSKQNISVPEKKSTNRKTKK